MPKSKTPTTTMVTVIAPSDSVHITNRYRYVARIGYQSKLVKAEKKKRLPFFKSIREKYQFYKIIREETADVYHAHYTIAESSIFTFIANKSPLIITTMGADILYKEQGDPTKAIAKAGKLILNNVEAITVKTHHNEQVVQGFGVSKDNISIIPWGVDTTVFYETSSLSSLPPELITNLKNKKVILQPRGLPSVYNNELILDAIVMLKSMYSKPFVVWFPKAATSLECANFLQLAIKKGVESHIVVSHPLTPQQMNEALSLSDVLVSVASSDGLPMSILEAMSVGTPAIVGNLPHLTKALEKTGVIWTVLDARNLANSLLKLFNKPLSEQQKQALIKSSLEQFGLDNDLQTYRNVIEKVATMKQTTHKRARLKVLGLYLFDKLVKRLSPILGRKNLAMFYVRN